MKEASVIMFYVAENGYLFALKRAQFDNKIVNLDYWLQKEVEE